MINFIQLGAHCGNTKQDIIWPIIRDKGWNGIFVEPHPDSFAKLIQNYSDLDGSYFENLAIDTFNGSTVLYYAPEGRTEIASTNKLHSSANTLSIEVNCITLTELCKKYNMIGVEFELLQMDTEGCEDRIILSTDFTNILAKYIRFEYIHFCRVHLNESDFSLRGQRVTEVLNHLEKFGYKPCVDMYNYNRPEAESGIDIMVERIFND